MLRLRDGRDSVRGRGTTAKEARVTNPTSVDRIRDVLGGACPGGVRARSSGVLNQLDVEAQADRLGDVVRHLQAGAVFAGLHAADDGLGHADALGEFALGEPALLPRLDQRVYQREPGRQPVVLTPEFGVLIVEFLKQFLCGSHGAISKHKCVSLSRRGPWGVVGCEIPVRAGTTPYLVPLAAVQVPVAPILNHQLAGPLCCNRVAAPLHPHCVADARRCAGVATASGAPAEAGQRL